MFLAVDPSDSLPIYEQIARQVQVAIAGGAIRSGELLPSVRELARSLAVNPNTVARAYRELQSTGLLVPVRGTGVAVAPSAAARCQPERHRSIQSRLRRLLLEARQSGLSQQQLRKLLRQELDRLETREVNS